MNAIIRPRIRTLLGEYLERRSHNNHNILIERRPCASKTTTPPERRRRKRTSLQQRIQQQTPTLKDRLITRRMPHHHRRTTTNPELVAERLTTRLEWVRTSLQALWVAAEPSGTISKTKIRYADAPMDANWWFWNLLLMSAPSLFIAVYCEVIAKPRMLKENDDGNDPLGLAVSSAQPTSSSWKNTWSVFVHWIQGKEWIPEEENVDGAALAKQSLSNSIQSPETQTAKKIQELQRQLGTLQAQLDTLANDDAEESSPKLIKRNHPRMSPVQQRHLQGDGVVGTVSSTKVPEEHQIVNRGNSPTTLEKDDSSSPTNHDEKIGSPPQSSAFAAIIATRLWKDWLGSAWAWTIQTVRQSRSNDSDNKDSSSNTTEQGSSQQP